MVFSGSNTVLLDMKASEKIFQPIDLSEATCMVHEYAETCVASNADIADCRNLSGHVHVAAITKGGFEWITEPKDLKK